MSDKIVIGLEQLTAKLQKLGDAGRPILGKSLLAGALVLEGIVKVSISGQSKHGRRYGKHIASAPGEPPANYMGALVNSIHSRETEEVGQAAAEVFTNAEYGPALEFGNGHLAARPFMRPAADEHQNEVDAAAQITAKRLIEEAANAL